MTRLGCGVRLSRGVRGSPPGWNMTQQCSDGREIVSGVWAPFANVGGVHWVVESLSLVMGSRPGGASSRRCAMGFPLRRASRAWSDADARLSTAHRSRVACAQSGRSGLRGPHARGCFPGSGRVRCRIGIGIGIGIDIGWAGKLRCRPATRRHLAAEPGPGRPRGADLLRRRDVRAQSRPPAAG